MDGPFVAFNQAGRSGHVFALVADKLSAIFNLIDSRSRALVDRLDVSFEILRRRRLILALVAGEFYILMRGGNVPFEIVGPLGPIVALFADKACQGWRVTSRKRFVARMSSPHMLPQVGLTGPQVVAGWTGVFDIAVAGLPTVKKIPT